MANELTTFVFSDDDYRKAAKKWAREFLLLPVLSIMDTLKYFTGMGGVRYKVALPTMSSAVGFGPYNPRRKTNNPQPVVFRELETYLGSVITDFEPNSIVQTLLGALAATVGDGQKQAPSVKLVVAAVMKSLGDTLRAALFTAKRNGEGTTTADLFDGFMTIVEKEITAGLIAAAKGNLFKPGTAITSANACEIFKEAERSCNPVLRRTEKFLYCAPEYADMYNDSYLLTHQGLSYNTKYNQVFVEGSSNLTTIVPLDCMAGLTKAIIAPKKNMIYGYDNMSDVERIQIDRFEPFMLTLSATMFFGTQIYTTDPRYLNVIDFDTTGGGQQEDDEEGGEDNP